MTINTLDREFIFVSDGNKVIIFPKKSTKTVNMIGWYDMTRSPCNFYCNKLPSKKLRDKLVKLFGFNDIIFTNTKPFIGD